MTGILGGQWELPVVPPDGPHSDGGAADVVLRRRRRHLPRAAAAVRLDGGERAARDPAGTPCGASISSPSRIKPWTRIARTGRWWWCADRPSESGEPSLPLGVRPAVVEGPGRAERPRRSDRARARGGAAEGTATVRAERPARRHHRRQGTPRAPARSSRPKARRPPTSTTMVCTTCRKVSSRRRSGRTCGSTPRSGRRVRVTSRSRRSAAAGTTSPCASSTSSFERDGGYGGRSWSSYDSHPGDNDDLWIEARRPTGARLGHRSRLRNSRPSGEPPRRRAAAKHLVFNTLVRAVSSADQIPGAGPAGRSTPIPGRAPRAPAPCRPRPAPTAPVDHEAGRGPGGTCRSSSVRVRPRPPRRDPTPPAAAVTDPVQGRTWRPTAYPSSVTWTSWFSDEGASSRVCPGGVVTGIDCNGRYATAPPRHDDGGGHAACAWSSGIRRSRARRRLERHVQRRACAAPAATATTSRSTSAAFDGAIAAVVARPQSPGRATVVVADAFIPRGPPPAPACATRRARLGSPRPRTARAARTWSARRSDHGRRAPAS